MSFFQPQMFIILALEDIVKLQSPFSVFFSSIVFNHLSVSLPCVCVSLVCV